MFGRRWECASTDPGVVADPAQLEHADAHWITADVPGTAAGALRAQGLWRSGVTDTEIFDGRDWWFRSRFPDPADGPWLLKLGGLATLADVWLNGSLVLHSENMFVSHEVEIDHLQADNELLIRFAALNPVLAARRPRPRWKSRLIRHQNLRWIRTSLLGRMDGWAAWAAPVGPWRPVELVPRGRGARVVDSTIDARCDGRGGAVTVHATLAVSGARPTAARLRVGDTVAPIELFVNPADGDPLPGELGQGFGEVVVEGTVRLAEVERWWPHTHGAQPRYAVSLEIDDAVFPLSTVGFRTIEVDRHDDGFTFVVNDLPIFCRGALWVPPDVVSLTATPAELRASLELARDAGMNMLRLGGYGTYESTEFWDLCDELGVMVWQDCMLASSDPPDDDDFVAAIEAELTQVLTRLQGRPALALVCGSSETYQQAAMFGLELGSWESHVLEKTIPTVVERALPGVAYIPSSPVGGELPFDPSVGVSHYFGVGAYERPLSDARLAGVRFAAECLAFSNPPERASIDEMFGGSSVVGHAPGWKAGIARDAGTSWDFEDVRDHYVRELFGRDPLAVRYAESDYALDLGRAAVAQVMTEVMTEWRRPGSRCAGGLVLSWRDLWPGAGWGLLDSTGRPKAPWYALRHVLDPLAVLVSDEGLSGLFFHVVNDRPTAFDGRFQLSAYAENGTRVEHAELSILVEAHSSITVPATELLGGFRDLTAAYRFGPPAHDVVMATIVSNDGEHSRETFYLPSGSGRPRLPEIGLRASVRRSGADEWLLTITTERFAQWVVLDVAGCAASDSWFHLAPGTARTIVLRPDDPERTPRGEVRALNSREASSIRVEDAK